MKLYYAGAEDKQYEGVLVKMGITRKLESFHHLKGKPPCTATRPGYWDALLDSGGYSARTANIEISVENYASFINTYDAKLVFELDVMEKKERDYNFQYIQDHCPDAYQIPIMHYGDFILGKRKTLIKMAEEFPYIAIGGFAGSRLGQREARAYLNFIFSITGKKTRVHGLGITSDRWLNEFPFYSVDSTTWISSARYGRTADKTRLKHWDYYVKLHYLERVAVEAQNFIKREKAITAQWRARGVVWDEFDIKTRAWQRN